MTWLSDGHGLEEARRGITHAVGVGEGDVQYHSGRSYGQGMSEMCDSDLFEDMPQMRRRDIHNGMISQVDPAVSPGMENHRQLAAVQDLAHPSVHF